MGLFNFFKKPKEVKKEPYVSVIGENIHPEKGIELALDWNDDFIVYLRQNGYQGTSDELIVQKWLHTLYNDMSIRLQSKSNALGDFE